MTPRFHLPLRFCVVLFAGACMLSGQSQKPEDLALGKILVTPRESPDPLFAESVILLVRYSDAGALGLMINKRTTVPISRALRSVKGAAGHSDPMFVGGPVEMDTVFALSRAHVPPEGGSAVFGNIYFMSGKTALEKALGGAPNPKELRVYAGYCGWAANQLRNEARLGGWHIFNGSEDLSFDADPGTLWSRLIEKAEARIARFGFAGPHS